MPQQVAEQQRQPKKPRNTPKMKDFVLPYARTMNDFVESELKKAAKDADSNGVLNMLKHEAD